MTRTHALALLLILAVATSLALGQDSESFEAVQQIGYSAPRGLQYDPHFDQMVAVSSDGRLLLLDAPSYLINHVLYESGSYNAYQFSHDGRWLALAIDNRAELWDTQSGDLLATLMPESANLVTGPLMFADDDSLLLLTAVVPASQATRRSENDTDNLPWLWDRHDALDLASSTLPGRVEAHAFFSFRNGLILGPNDTMIAALPRRLQVLDAAAPGLPVVTEIPADRNEQDPLNVWFSATDDLMYTQLINERQLVQINTETKATFTIDLGIALDSPDLSQYGDFSLSNLARNIGPPASRETNSLVSAIFQDGNYPAQFAYHPITVTLLDVLSPVATADTQPAMLIYVFDEQTGIGYVDMIRPDASRLVVHPDQHQLMLRRDSGNRAIEIYDLDSGLLLNTITPAHTTDYLLTFNAEGSEVINDFQRFDAHSGAVIYEDLDFHPGFDDFDFSEDGQRLITIAGSDWWEWDLATGHILRRETLTLRGELIEFEVDQSRFLSVVFDDAGREGREVYEIDSNSRRSIFFENLPGQEILQIRPSPNWEHFLVVYANRAVALYSLDAGKRWFIEGADLPPINDSTGYRWLDNDRVMLTSDPAFGGAVPERIYGIDYHPSGLPQCLVDAFPETWTQWTDLWERLNVRLSPARLDGLTLELCSAMPSTSAQVDAIVQPSPVPTRVPISPRPVVIAGVPSCLTDAFPRDAVQYGRRWRELTAEVSPQQREELETLLCDGLGNAINIGQSSRTSISPDTLAVMTINIHTGERERGSFEIRDTTPLPDSLDLVLDEFERLEDIRPGDARLSPDSRLLAARTIDDHILIFTLPQPYSALAATATATVSLVQAEDERYVSVRPTATQQFEREGQPRPTITPTITPTGPAPASQLVNLPQRFDSDTICPIPQSVLLSNLADDSMPSGRLLLSQTGSPENEVIALDLGTGRNIPLENPPDCLRFGACNFSSDMAWVLSQEDTVYVARPDGSARIELFDNLEGPSWPAFIDWLDHDTVITAWIGYNGGPQPVPLRQYIEIPQADFSEPFEPLPEQRINELNTFTESNQPAGGTYAVVSTPFDSGTGEGRKYYLVDRSTQAADYFLRSTNPNFLPDFRWHPDGSELYYRRPDDPNWYIFNAATAQHSVLGEAEDIPFNGTMSRDGRYWIDSYSPEDDIRVQRQEAGLPAITHRVWDRRTGQTRYYCMATDPLHSATMPTPGAIGTPIPVGVSTMPGSALLWSPDNRYLAVISGQLDDGSLSQPQRVILILDTETGLTMVVPVNARQLFAWMPDSTEGGA